MNGQKPKFEGFFDDYFRKRLHDFRKTRSLTYQQLAFRLHCDWSTICKWETGKTSKCTGIMFTILRNLFDGEYDNWLQHDEQEQLKRMTDFLNVYIQRKQSRNSFFLCHRAHSEKTPCDAKRLESLPFSGSFTPLHIQRLVWLQTISRMSDEDFAQVIGCSEQTLRNWKKGRSTSCQTHFNTSLRLLFRGELDEKLMLFSSSPRP